MKKGVIRREEIIRTASELFLEKGLRETSVNDIVARLGVAKGTFYHYFATKDELVELFLQQMIDSHLQDIRIIVEDKSLDFTVRLRRCLEKFYRMASSPPAIQEMNLSQPELLRQDLLEEFTMRACDILAVLIEEGMNDGHVGSRCALAGCYTISLGIQTMLRRNAMHGILPTRKDFEDMMGVIEDLLRLEEGSLARAVPENGEAAV